MTRSHLLLLPIAMRRPFVSAVLLATSMMLGPQDAYAQRNVQSFNVLPIAITGVTVQNGQLFANGLIGSNPFQVPILVGSQQTGGPCPILDLQLGPIDLNVLGLRVQTSPICLDITARPGGGLLGDLLCAVGNLLQGGIPLADILAQLEVAGTLDRLLNGLTALLNQVVNRISTNSALIGASCSVLSLALGPIDLDLLGLVVELDNCANGPVTVNVTAIPGGGLLGDLLCGLGGRPLNNPLTPPVQRLLFQITQLLGRLLS